ncbi:lactosylceramide 1,3-N-acetyl-beta-D-glucosaminyltransferase A [Brachionichthys hirsutus]|uniref:lactosylceramide 1,3-N-acetyl-beta-D-glucosaminyltransferase A n=1 Tax=Brachionichthys hirsutus TaxID=412623 RepID=UPI0036050A60
MFINFRRIHKCQCMQLLTTGLLLSAAMMCWETLDHHVVSHVRANMYRYLVNSYDFLNSSYVIRTESAGGALANYPYLINHPDKCRGGGAQAGSASDRVLLLLFVKSSPENFDRRQAIRDTWGNESFVWSELGTSVKIVFALGVHPHVGQRAGVQRALLQEDHAYKDLIQQNFVDTFHNLTVKLVLQFQWSHTFCRQASFLMSADDDIFVHMPNLVTYLRQLLSRPPAAKDLWVGHVHRGAPPVRRKANKYHVPVELYPWPSYPDYTAGAGYVVSRDVAAKIYQATLLLNSSIYIDDVFMGICAKTMGVAPQEHGYFSGEAKAPYHPCIYDRMITSHGHAADVRLLWKAATDPAVRRRSRGLLGSLYCTAVRAMLLCLPCSTNTYSCWAAFT